MRWVKKPRKFSGVLNEPIIETVFEPNEKIVVSEQNIERAAQEAVNRARRRQVLKLGRLLAFYGIDSKDPRCWVHGDAVKQTDKLLGLSTIDFAAGEDIRA